MIEEIRQTSGSPRRAPPIVGRTAERALLIEQLSTIAEGRGQFCILSGEAGIGKTTMIGELLAESRRHSMQVLTGQCYDLMAARPYGIWLDLLQSYHPVEDDTIPLPTMLVGNDLTTITSQSDVCDQMLAFLAGLAGRAPTLVVLEDVHWADPASIELLRRIASHLQPLRLCLAITYRVDELTRMNPLYRQLPALIRESGGLRVDLGRLHRDDLAALVTTQYLLPEQDASRLVGFLERHADGNPFFAIELLRALEARLQEGLWWSGSAWQLGAIDPLVVPALVRQVIDARLDRLGGAVREPLALAAVIGQDVSIHLWQVVSGLKQESLIDTVEIALEWHVMTADADGMRVRFVHALTREALYESILPPRRRLLHRQVAESLIAGQNPDPDDVAYHLHRAGDSRTSEWMIRAGERAQRAYAWLTAWDRFRTAADVLADIPGEERTRALLLYRCGRLQRYSDASHGIEGLKLAGLLAEVAGDEVLAADAIYSQGLLRCFADAWDTGVVQMTNGIERMETMPLELSRIHWSTITWFADTLPMIDLAEMGDVDPTATALTELGVNHRRGGLPWFLAASGHLAQARAEADTFLGHVAGCGAGPLMLCATGHALFGRAMACAADGDPVGAHEALDAAREIYVRLDHNGALAFTWLTELQDVVLRYDATNLSRRETVANEARVALERAGGAFRVGISLRRAYLPLMMVEGRWDEAWDIASDTPEAGNYMLRRPVTCAMAQIANNQGRVDVAHEYIRQLLPSGPETLPGAAVLQDALKLQELAVMMALDADDPVLARRWLEANDRWLAWSGSVLGRAENAILWAHFEMAAGRFADAAKQAERAVQLTCDPVQPLAHLDALREQGVVAWRQGDRATAEMSLRAALDLADACAAPFARAQTLVALAETQLGEESRLMLAESKRICESLHATPLLAVIEALEAKAGNRTRRTDDLTPREREVLRLAAEGLTDAEIGSRLFISPRTASQHLRSIYAKLDVRSRAAATRFAIEHDLT